MRYGQLPAELGKHDVDCNEMMLYQYLPIKLSGSTELKMEQRLNCFEKLVGNICCDFVGVFGLDRFVQSYVYVTAKYLFQVPNCPFNRKGWHSDGFMTDDINYIWSDKQPTLFNICKFNLTMDDAISLDEMEQQADEKYNVIHDSGTLLRLDQFNIHRVNENIESGMRKFLKVSFSKDKCDLIGNSHNYLLDYNWEMRERQISRNIPQTINNS